MLHTREMWIVNCIGRGFPQHVNIIIYISSDKHIYYIEGEGDDHILMFIFLIILNL